MGEHQDQKGNFRDFQSTSKVIVVIPSVGRFWHVDWALYTKGRSLRPITLPDLNKQTEPKRPIFPLTLLQMPGGSVTPLIDRRGVQSGEDPSKIFWPQITSNGSILPRKIPFDSRGSIAKFLDTVHFSINSSPNLHKRVKN